MPFPILQFKTGLLTPCHQELTGSPKFLCASLHTCHALMTPADPPESHLFNAEAGFAKELTIP
ncbi:hypothetical protein [Desulfonema magnum]|uniref:Uncharacterized protein n=1 Tax=Desulfonema magnum TaxID=45655 RepID=A0A975GSB8_9BACT|nr:hypothetical protein [Desulfonema magnum]QTA90913.1 Uncharacterized protein dnm_069750 [Desulfonema magnum]